jgi:hypothetical protein
LSEPENDDFIDAIELFGISGTSSEINTDDATAESGEPDHAGSQASHSVWWTYTALADGNLTLDTLLSDFDTV